MSHWVAQLIAASNAFIDSVKRRRNFHQNHRRLRTQDQHHRAIQLDSVSEEVAHSRALSVRAFAHTGKTEPLRVVRLNRHCIASGAIGRQQRISRRHKALIILELQPNFAIFQLMLPAVYV
jgi:hypothetical protein